jgi:hypothetical protein
MRNPAIAIVAFACALAASLAPPARAQVQTPAQRKCTGAIDKALAGVSAAAARGHTACLRDASRGALPQGSDLLACAEADAGGKLAKAIARTGAAFAGKCAGALPPYGVTDAGNVGSAAADAAPALLYDLLGETIDAAVLAEAAGKPAAKCQQLAVRETQACQATVLRELDRCKRAGLKNKTAPFDDADDLAACFGADPKGAIAKRCGSGLEAKLRKSCEAKGVDLAAALPGCGAAGVAETRACLDRAATCRACLTAADAGALPIDCDLADDATANASCGAVPVGALACPFDPESSFFLESDSIFYGGTLAGSVTMDCGTVDPATGTAACSCALGAVDPVEIAGGRWVCVSPVAGCPAGTLACDGGPSLDALIAADHDIGACTSNTDCATQCGAQCAAAGSSVWHSGCEGFCAGGTADGTECSSGADCPGGSCNGMIAGAHGNVCQCQCLDLAGEPSRPGGLRCHLGARIRIENDLPCDGADVVVDTGDRCLPLTTEGSQATLVDRDLEPGETLPPGIDLFSGLPVACETLRESGPAGMLLFSTGNTFDVPLAGDSYLVFGLACD